MERADDYPWYTVVTGDSLAQGDLLDNCPVFIAPAELAAPEAGPKMAEDAIQAEFRYEPFDLIVMSQTCDLVEGREKVDEVLLCPVHVREEFPSGQQLSRASTWEEARKGRLPAYHVLAECDLEPLRTEPRIVSFRRTFSLPIAFVRRFARAHTPRLRLMPPYREHLSQAFARFFMRVGLPADIPAFK